MGEIADVVGGGTPKTKDPTNFEGGSIPWLTPADLSGYTEKHIGHGARSITKKGLDGSSAKLMPAGTVLFTSRAPIGYVAIAANSICTNQGFKSFVLKDGVLPDYVYWWLKGSKALAESLASGTTFLELSGAKAKQIPIPIAPPGQQAEIVAEIEKQFSRLDEAVANLHRVKANLKRYKSAVLKTAVEGRLVETEAEFARREGRTYETGDQLLERILKTRREEWKGKGRYKEPAYTRRLSLPKLPTGWAWATLVQLNTSNRPCAYGVLQPGVDLEDGVPFVRVGDINDGHVDLTGLKKISPEIAAKYPRTKLEGGELLITLVGAIGRTSLAPETLKGANVARAVGVIPLTKAVDSRWVEIWFRNPVKVAEMTSKSHEVARKTLNLEDVRTASVAIPPHAEQRRIVTEVERQLSFLRETRDYVEKSANRLGRFRQSILLSAFIGKLEVACANEHEVERGGAQ